jgi:hypothetical protein
MLMIIIIALFLFYDYLDPEMIAQRENESASLPLIIVLIFFFHVFILLTERYISRADTRISRKPKTIKGNLEEFKKEDIIQN